MICKHESQKLLSLENKEPQQFYHCVPLTSPNFRRWSAIDDLSRLSSCHNWLDEERQYLRQNHIRQHSLEVIPEKIAKQVDLPQYHWGLPRSLRGLLMEPAPLALKLYGRSTSRIVGATVAMAFFALGSWLFFISSQVIQIQYLFSTQDYAVDFWIPTTMPGPVYLHQTYSNFWQNARDFLHSQPSQLGRLFHCKGFENAGQLCNLRPYFSPTLLNASSFCHLPPSTKVWPCGSYALFLNTDSFRLTRLKKNPPRSSVPRWLPQSRNQTLKSNYKILYHHKEEEPLIEGATSSLLLPLMQDEFQEIGNNLNLSDTSAVKSSTSNKVDSKKSDEHSGAYRKSAKREDGRHIALYPQNTKNTEMNATQEIKINTMAEILLEPFQLTNQLKKESILLKNAASDAAANGAKLWLEPDDIRWFLWRRPGFTKDFSSLFGRIDTSLNSGLYRLEFLVNEFPNFFFMKKGFTLTSGVDIIGTYQYGATLFCFLIGILYSSLFLI